MMTRLQYKPPHYYGKYVVRSCKTFRRWSIEPTEEEGLVTMPVHPSTDVIGVFDSKEMAIAVAKIDFYKNSNEACMRAVNEMGARPIEEPGVQCYPILGWAPHEFDLVDAAVDLAPEDILSPETGTMSEAAKSVLSWAKSNNRVKKRDLETDNTETGNTETDNLRETGKMNETLKSLRNNDTEVHIFMFYTNGICAADVEAQPYRAPVFSYRSAMTWVETFKQVHDFILATGYPSGKNTPQSSHQEQQHHGTKRGLSLSWEEGREAGRAN